MSTLKQRLLAGEILLADGAMGTQLQARGLTPGQAPETWNLTRPDDLAEIAAAYAEAGADLVQANSFGASPLRLAAHGLADQMEEINRVAVEMALQGSAGRTAVYGSLGPVGKLLAPLGDVQPAEVLAGFRRQAEVLATAGVDLFCIETMIDLQEALLAVQAAREALPDGVVMACLTFDRTPAGWFTIMGQDVPTAAAALQGAGADVIGSNCGQGTAGMLEVADAFSAASELPLVIQANAGLPVLQGDELTYPETPDQMASVVPALAAAGVRVIGGCCGTTPGHTRAMREALDRIEPQA